MAHAQIIRLPAVLTKVGLKRSTVYRLVAIGKFPGSVKLGARSVGWIEAEVDDWIDRRIAASRGSGV